jgi:hypothetical protein
VPSQKSPAHSGLSRELIAPFPSPTCTSTSTAACARDADRAREGAQRQAAFAQRFDGLQASGLQAGLREPAGVPEGLRIHRRVPLGSRGARARGLRAGGGLRGRELLLPRGALRAAAPRARGLRSVHEVMRAVCKGPAARARSRSTKEPEVRAGTRPPFRSGVIVCAMRFFNQYFSEHYASYFRALPLTGRTRSSASPRRSWRRRRCSREEEGLPVVGFDLAGQERGYPAEAHAAAYQIAHRGFLGKTVHAGEDYGPESIFQAITHCYADRIGHGTWLFSGGKLHDAFRSRTSSATSTSSCATSRTAASRSRSA